MKTPIQKGKIISDQPTMKHMSFEKRAQEDFENRKMRFENQTLRYVSPKAS